MTYLKELAVNKENVPYYNELGKSFEVINRESSPIEFNKAYNALYRLPEDKVFELSEINSEIYCIVVSEGGKEMFLLNRNNYYYIVSESGKTLVNLTFK